MMRWMLALFLLGTLSACLDQQGVSVTQECEDSDSCKEAIVDPSTSYCVKHRLADKYNELDGNGSPGSPYIICTAAQFVDIGKNQGAWSKSFLLAQDIDLSQYYVDGGSHFQIGSCGQTSCRTFGAGHIQYSGTFDGAGYAIDNFRFDIESSESGAAMFGSLSSNAIVANVEIAGAQVSGKDTIGLVAGRNDGVINNVTITDGNLRVRHPNTVAENVGVVAGLNKGIVRNVEVNKVGQIIASANTDSPAVDVSFTNIGGIVGLNEQAGYVGYTTNTATLSINNAVALGGIAGKNSGFVTFSKNTASLGVASGNGNGGIVGIMSHFGQVTTSYNTALILTGSENTGGIVGEITFPTYGSITASEDEDRALVSDCYNTGEVRSTEDHVGGIVGFNRGLVRASYHATGDIRGEDYVGGIVGRNDFTIAQTFVHNANIDGDSLDGAIFGSSSTADKSDYVATAEEKGNGIVPRPIFEQSSVVLADATYPFNTFTNVSLNAGHEDGGIETNGVNDYFDLSFDLYSKTSTILCPNPAPAGISCETTTIKTVHWDFTNIWKRKTNAPPDLGF
jgi:hypothetical protein